MSWFELKVKLAFPCSRRRAYLLTGSFRARNFVRRVTLFSCALFFIFVWRGKREKKIKLTSLLSVGSPSLQQQERIFNDSNEEEHVDHEHTRDG